ncbi:hypothetical protein BV455_03573 [Parageobacillus caldoxylosilyticus]|nr:hypothetical protein BV455_03573 [Parageobacillus caldoxylosilyticus]
MRQIVLIRPFVLIDTSQAFILPCTQLSAVRFLSDQTGSSIRGTLENFKYLVL